MVVLQNLHIPDFIPYGLAILGLLLLWRLHASGVQAGRIQAIDIWDRSGIRLFIHATPLDNMACPACREAHGLVFLPSLVANRKFTAMPGPCTNPSGCRCVLVGLYAGWPEARRVFGLLRIRRGRVRLAEDELAAILRSPLEIGRAVSIDQVPVRLLNALLDEGCDPEAAILGYSYVIENVEEERDSPFLIPSYFRLSDLLERVARPADALPIVDRFLKRYENTSQVAATESQLSMMKARQIRLMMILKTATA
ncbi:MAG TPA: hypothetical protein VGJ57_02670 [Nitrospirales bacterium]|jgi:hypothetical protein